MAVKGLRLAESEFFQGLNATVRVRVEVKVKFRVRATACIQSLST